MPNGFYVSAADLGRTIRVLLKERKPRNSNAGRIEGSGTTRPDSRTVLATCRPS